jgi:hypothetical protein
MVLLPVRPAFWGRIDGRIDGRGWPLRKFLGMRALLAFSKTVAVFAFNVLNATWH